eukprot:COSAG04_NODE_12894_length_630_cov_0.775895_1_plen_143_part_10
MPKKKRQAGAPAGEQAARKVRAPPEPTAAAGLGDAGRARRQQKARQEKLSKRRERAHAEDAEGAVAEQASEWLDNRLDAASAGAAAARALRRVGEPADDLRTTGGAAAGVPHNKLADVTKVANILSEWLASSPPAPLPPASPR